MCAPFPHEHGEDDSEGSLGGSSVQVGETQVRRIKVVSELPERGGEAAQSREHLLSVQVGQPALGDDRQPLAAIQRVDEAPKAPRPGVAQYVEIDDAVAAVRGDHPSERAALALGHLGKVALDVGQALAVALGEAPAARRHAARRLDHLADLAGLDSVLEQAVDDAGAVSSPGALQRGSASSRLSAIGGSSAPNSTRPCQVASSGCESLFRTQA